MGRRQAGQKWNLHDLLVGCSASLCLGVYTGEESSEEGSFLVCCKMVPSVKYDCKVEAERDTGGPSTVVT